MSFRGAALVVTVPFAFGLGACAKRGEPEAYGRTLVETVSLQASAIKRLNSLAPPPGSTALPDKPARWRSPGMDLGPAANPFVVALRVKGRVTGAEGAQSRWMIGFEPVDANNEPTDGVVVHRVLGAMDAKAGGTDGAGGVDLRKAAQPMNLKEFRRYRIVVDLESKAGLELEGVQVELWSGLADPTWKEWAFGLPGALVGVVMLLLVALGFRRR